jgi:D-threo-aldose 1-dehydrogenase
LAGEETSVIADRDQLPKRPLGRTALAVTPLSVGCASLGDMPETFGYGVPEERALEVLRAVFNSPINFLDTAAAYGDGESERRIGRVLREIGGLPSGFVLATKADRNLATREFSGDQARRSIECSLRLLGVDRLQLVHVYDPEHSTATFEQIMGPGGPVEALQRYKEEGIIQHLGIAGGPIDLLTRYIETGSFEVVITHNRYTLLHRGAEPLFKVAAERGVAVLNGAPYASGLLAKGPDTQARYAYQAATSEVTERVRKVAEVCARYDVPLAAAALQFSMRHPLIASTIVGVTRTERIAETLQLAKYTIPAELWRDLEPLGNREGDPQEDSQAALRAAGAPRASADRSRC